jgi:hypothetical protein
VLRIRIREMVPFWPRDPGGQDPGWEKLRTRIRDLGWTTWVIFPRAYKPFFGLKYLNFWWGSPWKKSDVGGIRDPGLCARKENNKKFGYFWHKIGYCYTRFLSNNWHYQTTLLESAKLKLQFVRFQKGIKNYYRTFMNSHSVAAGKYLQLMPFYSSTSSSVSMKVVEDQPKGKLSF